MITDARSGERRLSYSPANAAPHKYACFPRVDLPGLRLQVPSKHVHPYACYRLLLLASHAHWVTQAPCTRYFSAPEKYLGDRSLSHGGKLKFRLGHSEYMSNGRDMIKDWDVILESKVSSPPPPGHEPRALPLLRSSPAPHSSAFTSP